MLKAKPDSPITKAQIICLIAHEGQVDKNGEEYWRHPFAVADLVSQAAVDLRASSDEMQAARIAAYLHDVVEDANITLRDLLDEGFSQAVVEAVDAVTRREGETYEEFVLRAKEDPIGRIVKLADLRHNTAPERNPNGPREKYVNAIECILG